MTYPMTYPDDWPEIAAAVKDEAGWRCVRCDHPNEWGTAHVLTVHHLDGDKANCEWWNLPALCQRCHLSIQGRVKMEQGYALPHSKWFWPYVAGYYAWLHTGKRYERAQVEGRLVDFLTLGQPHLRAHYTEALVT